MRRASWVGPVVLGLVVSASIGCQSQPTVPKADLDDLKTRYDQVVNDNKSLRQNVEELQTQLAAPKGPGPGPSGGGPTVDELKKEFGPGVEIVLRGGQPVIVVESGLLYASGKADLTPSGMKILDKVAKVLNSRYPTQMIRVEGHTDTDPIRKTKNLYKSNWDLGAKRACEVVEHLQAKGVDPKRMYAASFGQYDPLSSQKSKNRRVEIVVLAGEHPAGRASRPATKGATPPSAKPMEPATTSSTMEESEPK
jgi:chemotaxis protein MotB